MNAPVEKLHIEELHIDVETAREGLRVTWEGRSTHRDPGKLLHPFFERILERARQQSLPISMHFEKLEQFNSSTIAALIQLINVARDSGVPMMVHYDKSLKWQTLSFEALQRAIEPFQPGDAEPVQFMPVPVKGK
jgi:hypothetical protein